MLSITNYVNVMITDFIIMITPMIMIQVMILIIVIINDANNVNDSNYNNDGRNNAMCKFFASVCLYNGYIYLWARFILFIYLS